MPASNGNSNSLMSHHHVTLDTIVDRLDARANQHYRTMARIQFDQYHDDYAHAREHGNHAALVTAKAGMDFWSEVLTGDRDHWA